MPIFKVYGTLFGDPRRSVIICLLAEDKEKAEQLALSYESRMVISDSSEVDWDRGVFGAFYMGALTGDQPNIAA